MLKSYRPTECLVLQNHRKFFPLRIPNTLVIACLLACGYNYTIADYEQTALADRTLTALYLATTNYVTTLAPLIQIEYMSL